MKYFPVSASNKSAAAASICIFSSAWDVVTTKEEIDNTSNSKIDKIFSYRLSPSHRYLAYSSYHFSISLHIKRLQFYKKFEKCWFFFKSVEKGDF